MTREDVLDGWGRWQIPRCKAVSDLIPHIIFPAGYRNGLYSEQGHHLPRLLALLEHYERAYSLLPDCWSQSALDVQAYLGLPLSLALQVYRARPKCKQKFSRYEQQIRSIRHGLGALREGEPFTLDDVARILSR